MSDTPSNPLLLPDAYIQALAEAADKGQLTMILVLGAEQLAKLLVRGHVLLKQLDDGGAIVLVTTELIKRTYDHGETPS